MIDLDTRVETAEKLSSRELDVIFDYASDQVLNVSTEDDYFNSVELISARRPDLPSNEIQAYVLANYAHRYLEVNPMSDTRAAALVLFCSLPNFIIQAAKLNEARSKGDEDPIALKSVSQFNGCIRDFAAQHPELSTGQLSDRLEEGLEKSTIHYTQPSSPGERPIDPVSELRKRIRGARSEIGFEQWLDSAGISFKRGNTDDDIRLYVDYKVHYGDKIINIDIKKSSYSPKLKDALYNIDYTGKVTLVCPVQAQDFVRDTFELSKESKAKAPDHAETLLSLIAKDLR